MEGRGNQRKDGGIGEGEMRKGIHEWERAMKKRIGE